MFGFLYDIWLFQTKQAKRVSLADQFRLFQGETSQEETKAAQPPPLPPRPRKISTASIKSPSFDDGVFDDATGNK